MPVEPRLRSKDTNRSGHATGMIEIGRSDRDGADKNLAAADEESIFAREGNIGRNRRSIRSLGQRAENGCNFIILHERQNRFSARAAPQVIGFAEAARYRENVWTDQLGNTLT